MIGNRGYAMYIREWVRAEQGDWESAYDSPRHAPAGWKYLGQGCFRAAYLSPDNVVYKVQHYAGTGQSNFTEYRKYNRLRLEHKLPEGARFPLLQHFALANGDGVNAMDHVGPTLNKYTGDDYHKHSSCLADISRQLRLWDMHHGNAAVDVERGLIVPIDLG